MRKALEAPLRSLAANAGEEGSIIVQSVLKKKTAEGYNVATGEYVDLVKAGVVDPKTAPMLWSIDNQGGEENCLHLARYGPNVGLNDLHCDKPRPFLCQVV